MLHNQDSLDSYNIYNKFMEIQTYRDRLTWKIVAYDPVTNTEKYLWPQEYKDKVSSWLVSGKPLDASLSPYRTGQQPNTSTWGSTPSWLGSLDKMSRLKAAANELILMANNRNKDLTDAWQYWRRMGWDPSAFWTQDASIPATQQTPESYRLLSPSQQASIRSAREAAASAWLRSVEDERLSRERTAWTSLGNLVDMYQETNRREESDRNYNLQRDTQARAIINAKLEMGIPLTEEDYKTLWTTASVSESGAKTDWSISWRNNNPGNLKFRPWQEEYGAKKDPNSAYAVFPNEQAAKQAYKDLLTSEREGAAYKWLTPNQAMLKWSSDYPWDPRAYDYNKLVTLWAPAVSKPFSKFTDEEWEQLFEAQKRAEWWQEGTFISWKWWNTYTDTQLRTLAKKADIDLADLKWLSDQELIAIEQSINVPPLEKVADSEAWNRIMAAYWINDKTLLIAIMNLVNQDIPYELKKEQLQQYGIKPEIIEAVNRALWKEY